MANRLKANGYRSTAVLNLGIGGNCLTHECLGPNAVTRFNGDALSVPGVRSVIILEGINDIGGLTHNAPVSPEVHKAFVEQIKTSLRQLAMAAKAHGIKAIGATVMPFFGSDYYHPDQTNEADRQAINDFIRSSGTFDAVIDFDALTRDPKAPEHLRAEYDCGDHLHPSAAGYKAMGDYIKLDALGLGQ